MMLRRTLETLVLVVGLGLCTMAHADMHDEHARAVARQQIEYLRRTYAIATDQIATNEALLVAEGRATYDRIFTPDVRLSASSTEDQVFEATGPTQWADVVQSALKVFDATQHLIGTQVVTIHSLPDENGKGGEATMTSYLQAWHSDPGRVLDIFIGTYHDKVRYTPETGWQIYESFLQRVSQEITPKGA